jgi:curved DNA-binding protein CbpA
MTTPDPYRLLQVHPEADAEIIQVAYRKLAQRYHPDVTSDPEAARRMAELNAARDLLLDPAARAAYDRAGRPAGSVAAAPPGWAPAPSAAAPGSSGSPSSDAAPGSRGSSGPPGSASAPAEATAGPPPGNPSGSVLTFGRYAGWSLGEIARRDVEYVEWLDRMPIGRPYRAEIDALLRAARRRGGSVKAEEPRGLYRRR